MAFDQLRLIGKVLTFVFPFLGKLLLERVVAVRHRWTYKLVPGAKNVVVLGGSFAGIELAKRLAETLPTGFKAVWIEKNSHLNYSFAFPRFSVARGYEHKAFIPYDGVAKSCPPGILTRVQNTVVDITASHVALASGEKIDYEYLAIATGSSQPLPVQVAATERADACAELRSVQDTIRDSQRIALVGGGAVGIQLASDIKSFYPDKEVTLVHSRGQLLNHFGKRLHDYVLSVLREQKISVLLNERPQLPPGGSMSKATTLKFSDGHEESFDLVMGCTGQRPNSSILRSLHPHAISEKTSRILVSPTLQVLDADNPCPNIFALGDVAEHGGPCMARAGFFQSQIVLANILAMIHNRAPSKTYVPRVDFESAIKLTLGQSRHVVYTMNDDGSDILIPGKDSKIDLGVARAWSQYGADFGPAGA